ncbi:iron-containing alcohol dehydrogenase [Benzoatithermus flavus]|uniref:Iron-containing alcohol dehydrogenase n=1 Tax=Benzoatithermus flavus TaxID=3108223 RepID=A0ABU8XR53_9PROT
MPELDLASLSTTWNYPTTVLFGAGSLEKAARACESAGIRRPLVVTDPGLAKLPLVQTLLDHLRAGGLEAGLFTDVRPNPVAANVEAGLEVLRAGGHDGVVALGGGSALDAGKVIAFMAGQTRPMWDFEDIGDWWKRADPKGILPIVAIPTTAGTGSEVGRAGVITDEATHTKKIIFHPLMMPKTAILDPEITVGLPRHLTAATGMDALAHCIEAYCARGYHPMAEGIAVEGIRLVKEALPRACADGKDLAARGMMLTASSMGAVAFQKGLGAIHSLSHPVGSVYDTHHGLTNAVVMPYVLAFNRPAIEAKIERLAAWLGLEGGFSGFMRWVLDLRRELGIPHTLQELGVPADRFDELAGMAVKDPTAGGNPVPLDVAAARRLFEEAYSGRAF